MMESKYHIYRYYNLLDDEKYTDYIISEDMTKMYIKSNISEDYDIVEIEDDGYYKLAGFRIKVPTVRNSDYLKTVTKQQLFLEML